MTTFIDRSSRVPPASVMAQRNEHPQFLQHHFDSLAQQFEASKLGMWLFLATEVLLFGGLFCGYAVYRGNHPEIFQYGSRFLDTTWGAVNTVVLILSSVTMASAVTAAQRNRCRALIVLLCLTFLGGAIFMGVKFIEYSHKIHENLVWGTKFYEQPDYAHPPEALALVEPAAPITGDATKGKALWMNTCRSCHGKAGEGIPGQGKDQRGSQFIASKTDHELVKFIKVGRMPFHPLNTTGIQMPPKGGNPLLTDEDLLHIVAYIRTFPPAPDAADAEAPADEQAAEFFIPRSTIPKAADGPAGLRLAALDEALPPEDPRAAKPVHHSRDPNRPDNAHLFFAFYFSMTGLHGVHVLAGMIMIAWLTVRALKGHFGADYFTPIDLGGLYWHVVDLIWIFLFPLFYLI